MTAHDVSISTFVSKLNGGLIKANRFCVEFNMPKGVADMKEGINPLATAGSISGMQFALNGEQKINIFCHTCTLPQRTLQTYSHKQLSGPYLVPYSQSYDPVTFSFYADDILNTRRYFDIWQTAVVNTMVNTMNYYDEFTSDIMIYTIDDKGDYTYGVQLVDCYPLTIGMVDMTYGSSDLLNVTVTMAFKQWIESGSNMTGAAK